MPGRRIRTGLVTTPVRGLLAALVVVALTGSPREAVGPPPKVAATIFPLYDIARQVAGTAAEVVLILPPGASPHTFEPTPDQVRRLSDARALFLVGHGLDDWAVRAARSAGVSRIVPVDAGITLRRSGADEHGHVGGDPGSVDPHYWLAFGNAGTIARTVAAELERLVPERRAELARSLAAYLERLDRADAEVRHLLAGLPIRRIATFHDSFAYFAQAYGLEVVAVFEPYPGREPSPRYLQEFHRRIRAAGVRVIFSEPQLSVDAIRPIARDLGVVLSVLDPLGGLPGREEYVQMMRFNARQVAAAARARAP